MMARVKRLLPIALIIAVVIVAFVSGFSYPNILLRNIPVYPLQDPCYGKRIIMEDDFNSGIIDSSKWILMRSSEGEAFIDNGVLVLRGANIRTNIENYKIPVNVTIVFKAKVLKTSDYKGFSQAYAYFLQDLGEVQVNPGFLSFSPNGYSVRIDDRITTPYYEDEFGGLSSFYHYQRKYFQLSSPSNPKLGDFHYYEINRTLIDGNYLKSFYANESLENLLKDTSLKAIMNLSKAVYDSNGNSIDEVFIIGSYSYQTMYVDWVKICA